MDPQCISRAPCKVNEIRPLTEVVCKRRDGSSWMWMWMSMSYRMQPDPTPLSPNKSVSIISLVTDFLNLSRLTVLPSMLFYLPNQTKRIFCVMCPLEHALDSLTLNTLSCPAIKVKKQQHPFTHKNSGGEASRQGLFGCGGRVT